MQEQGVAPTSEAERAAERAAAVLRDRAVRLARRAAPRRPEDDAAPVLAFEAGGERYAIAVAAVLRVERVARVARIPGAPPHVVGVVALGGRPCPLVDVPSLLGVRGAVAAPRRWALLLGERRAVLALAADSVETSRLVLAALRPSGGAGPRLGITADARIVLDAPMLLAPGEPAAGDSQ